MRIGRILNGGIALLGLYEAMSPFFLGWPNFGPGVRTSIYTGIALMLAGVLAAANESAGFGEYLDVITGFLGIWLITAPFIFGFSAFWLSATISSIVVGGLVLLASVIAFYEYYEYLEPRKNNT